METEQEKNTDTFTGWRQDSLVETYRRTTARGADLEILSRIRDSRSVVSVVQHSPCSEKQNRNKQRSLRRDGETLAQK